MKDRSFVLDAAMRFVKIVAADGTPIVDEEPHAHAVDVQRFGGDPGHLPQDIT